MSLQTRLGLFIAFFSFALYAQSISFHYALDDVTVLTKNDLVRQGLTAIPTLFKTDRLVGYTEEKVRPPEYRPVPMMIFAMAWQLFPDNPHFYHFINVTLYSLTCWLLFLLLYKLFKNHNLTYPFICALLFAAHPIHTEVVNNIKSLDEILCLLFAILSIYFFIKVPGSSQRLVLSTQNLLGLIFFFLSLLSKETGITFLIIIPLTLFVFTEIRPKKILFVTIPLVLVAGIYFFIRLKVFESLPSTLNDNFNSRLNNVVAAAPDFMSQKATALYILLKYLLLLILPYQLSYDYSFASIPVQQFSSPGALLGLLIYLFFGTYALIKIFNKKDVIAFGILFYLITLSPVANLLLLVGTGERFLYMPSLGFCMGLSFLLIGITKSSMNKSKFTDIKRFISGNRAILTIVFIMSGLYSIRTLARNPDWKNNLTLCSHDVNVVPNSALAHYNYGYELILTLPSEKSPEKRINILNKSAIEFSKAISIYNNFPRAYHYLATVDFDLGDYTNAIINYKIAMQLNSTLPPTYVYHHLGIAYTATSQYEKALNILDSALKYYPEYLDAYLMKSNTYLSEGKNTEAILESDKLLMLDSGYAAAYINKGNGYLNLKKFAIAIEYFNKGITLDSTNPDWFRYLGISYQHIGDTVTAAQYFEKAKKN